MKKIKTIIISAAFLVSGFILGIYITTTTAEQTWPLKIWFQNENGKMETYCLVDENTGVNYVVVSGELYQKRNWYCNHSKTECRWKFIY